MLADITRHNQINRPHSRKIHSRLAGWRRWAKNMALYRKIKGEITTRVLEKRAEFVACGLTIDPISWRDL
jgi:hypothetical protein